MKDDDQLLAAWGVTREEIAALDPTGSYASARAQAEHEKEAFLNDGPPEWGVPPQFCRCPLNENTDGVDS